MDLGLTGKTALVTAASKGLGKAAAMELARQGAQVAICARSDRVQSAADEIREATGATVLALRADVSRQEDVDRVVSSAIEQLGHLDILVLNAGGPPPGGFLAFGARDWEAAVRLTIMSTVYLCYAVVPHMLERGEGCLVASQSFTVRQPLDNLILSNAIRSGVIGLAKSLSFELAKDGIRVNNVLPGAIMTDRQRAMLALQSARSGKSVDEIVRLREAAIPLGRFGDPEDLGNMIAFLASERARYVTGVTVQVDGGLVRSLM